jgi:hypothetical protein
LQWHPSEDVMLTLDNNYSRQTITTDVFGFGVWFNQGDLRNVKQDANGTAVSFTQTGTPTDFTSAINKQVLQTNQTGLNVKWDVSPKLTVEADGGLAKSWLNSGGVVGSSNGDIGYGGNLGTNLGFNITGDSNKAFLTISNFGRWRRRTLGGPVADRLARHRAPDPEEHRRAEAIPRRRHLEGRQSDAEGGRSVCRRQILPAECQHLHQQLLAGYAGYGSPSGRTSGIAPLPSNLYQGSISLNNFIPGFQGGLPPSVLIYSPQAYQNYLTSLGNPQAQTVPGFNYGGGVNGFTGAFDQAIDPNSVRTIQEKTWSLFFSAQIEAQVASMPLHIAVGLRNENTHLSSAGQGRQPTTITRSAADRPCCRSTSPRPSRSSAATIIPTCCRPSTCVWR